LRPGRWRRPAVPCGRFGGHGWGNHAECGVQRPDGQSGCLMQGVEVHLHCDVCVKETAEPRSEQGHDLPVPVRQPPGAPSKLPYGFEEFLAGSVPHCPVPLHSDRLGHRRRTFLRNDIKADVTHFLLDGTTNRKTHQVSLRPRLRPYTSSTSV
jgi:hypothetical protein